MLWADLVQQGWYRAFEEAAPTGVGWYVERYDSNGAAPKWHATVLEFDAVKALILDAQITEGLELVRVGFPSDAIQEDHDAFATLVAGRPHGLERI
jgi:hypothetical protein